MSADINTFIEMRGSKEDLFAMLKVINYFEKEMYEQYCNEHNCGYVHFFRMNNGREELMLNDENSIREFLEKSHDGINVELSGPYGVFFALSEVGLFEAIADAAPNAYFNGTSSGFTTGGDIALSGELKDGKLNLVEYIGNDDISIEDAFIEEFQKILSYNEFCEIFHISDSEEFTEDEYDEFIMEIGDQEFPDIDFEYFFDLCSVAEIDEEEFEEIIEKLSERKFPDYYKFETEFMDELSDFRTYDPVKKEYI